MKLRHPLTRLSYDRRPDGTVLVQDDKGRSGIFDASGNWIEGSRKSADGMMCRFISDGYVPPWNRTTTATQSGEEKQL